MKNVFLSLLFLLLIFLFYLNRTSHIESYWWKSNSDYRISDFLHFSEKTYYIKGRKILGAGQKKGFVVLCLHKYLIVTNNDNKICVYVNKGESRE